MDARPLAVRNLTYGLFVDLSRAPTAEEVTRPGHVAPPAGCQHLLV